MRRRKTEKRPSQEVLTEVVNSPGTHYDLIELLYYARIIGVLHGDAIGDDSPVTRYLAAKEFLYSHIDCTHTPHELRTNLKRTIRLGPYAFWSTVNAILSNRTVQKMYAL